MKLWVIALKFLFIGALFIISNDNLALIDPINRDVFFDSFYSWLTTLFEHSLQIAGYVVNSGWLPGEDQAGPLETISV